MAIELANAGTSSVNVRADELDRPLLFPTSRNRTPSSHSIQMAVQEAREEQFSRWLRKPSRWVVFELLIVVFLSTSGLFSFLVPSLRQETVWSVKIWQWEFFFLVAVLSRRISSVIVTPLWLLLLTLLKSRNRFVYFLHSTRGDAEILFTFAVIDVPALVWFQSEERMVIIITTLISSLLVICTISTIRSVAMSASASWFHTSTFHRWVEECHFNVRVVKAFSSERFDFRKLSVWDLKKVFIKGEDGLCLSFKREAEARVAGSRLFQRVSRPGSEFFDLEDTVRFLPRAEALKFMSLFPDETSQINASLLENWMVHAFNHEKQLVMSMKTMDATASKAHKVVKITCYIIQLIVFISLNGIVGSWIFELFTPSFVLFAFLFGNTWKSIFDSLLYVFVQHPFDVGDRIKIDEEEFVVVDIQVLCSTFIGVDKVTVEYTNVELWTRSIKNFTRCSRKGEEVPRGVPGLGEAAAATSTNN